MYFTIIITTIVNLVTLKCLGPGWLRPVHLYGTFVLLGIWIQHIFGYCLLA